MMVLIDRKFNEEQLLLETFSPKMDIGGGSGGFNMLFRILFSNIFHTQNFDSSFL